MVIEIPGCKFRIKGTGTDWQIQYPTKERKDGKGEPWVGKYFFGSLAYAVDKAYELALRESDCEIDISGLPDECRKVKDSLLRAVRKALS